MFQDQRCRHSGLWEGRGVSDHPLHLLCEHFDELFEKLRQGRLQKTTFVQGQDDDGDADKDDKRESDSSSDVLHQQETRYIFLPDHDRDYLMMKAAAMHVLVERGAEFNKKWVSDLGVVQWLSGL